MTTIVLASRNKHKIEELRAILGELGVELKSALDFEALREVEEDQPTLEGNALKKARYVYGQTGFPALADDTGLEVDALNGRPGVYSARYAGENATYGENVEKLLEELNAVTAGERRAQFRTVIAFVSGEGEHTMQGVCRGAITDTPRGDKGFGYDPVFQPDGYSQTFAELDQEEKNRISHRGLAIAEFISFLRQSTN